jgi:hypothetical protein
MNELGLVLVAFTVAAVIILLNIGGGDPRPPCSGPGEYDSAT